jgi:hypothetical protein
MLQLRPSYAKVDQLRPSVFQLSLRLCYISPGCDPYRETASRKLEILFERSHSPLQQILSGIGTSQLEVILRQFRLEQKPRVFQFGSRGLRNVSIRSDGSANASPEITW